MYILILVMLMISALIELVSEKRKIMIFRILFLVLTFVICFRYGQGSDYFGYKYIYNEVPNEFLSVFNSDYLHSEIGWKLLCFVFKFFNLKFDVFVFCCSAIFMFFIYKAFTKLSPYPCISLLLLYPTFYLTYGLSAMRQGISFAVFLGVLVPMLVENKAGLKYYFICLLLTSIHMVSALYMILPLVLYIYKHDKKIFYGLCYLVLVFFNVVLYLKNGIGYFSFPALLVRIVYLFLIAFLHKRNCNVDNSIEKSLFVIYVCGFIIYLSFVLDDLYSQRISMAFKALEVILIPIELSLLKTKISNRVNSKSFDSRSLFVISLFILFLVPPAETLKNIDSYIIAGEYYSNINIFNYPYVSVFNKEDLNNYRRKSRYLTYLENYHIDIY